VKYQMAVITRTSRTKIRGDEDDLVVEGGAVEGGLIAEGTAGGILN